MRLGGREVNLLPVVLDSLLGYVIEDTLLLRTFSRILHLNDIVFNSKHSMERFYSVAVLELMTISIVTYVHFAKYCFSVMSSLTSHSECRCTLLPTTGTG